MPHAVTRAVSSSISNCQLTHLDRNPIDLGEARRQHALYERALVECGCTLVRLPPAPDLPDAVFVEDTAIVLDEIAVITRPGAPSRRAETTSVAATLADFRRLARLEAPATLDGGDVLRLGRHLFIGLTSRTNPEGVDQLRAIVKPCGYLVTPVPITACLHLKSAVTALSDDAVLVNPGWVDPAAFGASTLVEVDPTEPSAANALPIGSRVIFPAEYPRTAKRLEAAGFTLRTVPTAELAKAEGAVTCCSLIIS